MPVKVFILGSPGSGKSTACRIILEYILQYKEIKHTFHLSDYDILWEMFLDDLQSNPPDRRSFESTRKYAGFNVKPHAYAVLDEALRRVNGKMKVWLASQAEQWMLIEFSRDNYQTAFRLFDPSLLRDAYFLFIEAHEKHCRKRLRARIKDPRTPDDHFVSDDILNSYYKRTVPLHVVRFREEYGLAADQVDTIVNNGSLAYFSAKVKLFADRALRLQERLVLSGRGSR